MNRKDVIEADYGCCWFDFTDSNEVYQKCPFHNNKLLMRSDVKKIFNDRKTDIKPYLTKKPA